MLRLLPLGFFAAAVVFAGGCSRAPTRVVDRTIDLINRLGDAEGAGRSPYAVRSVATIVAEDPRDRIAYLQSPTGSSLTWRDLATSGTARLSFGIGKVWTDAKPDESATFLVEASVGDEAPVEVFRRTVRVADLPAPDRIDRIEIDLPGTAAGRRSIVLRTIAEGAPATWPAFFAPRITSGGRPATAAEGMIELEDVALDLVGALSAADVRSENPELPVARAKLDAAVDVAGAGGPRACVRMKAPARVRYRLRPPVGAVLEFSFGMDTETGWQLPGDGMRFAVEIDGERVFERALAAPTVVMDRGWSAGQVDLGRFAGKDVALELVTEPLGDATNDVGGFAEARVIRSRRVERRNSSDGPFVLVLLVDTLRADALAAGRTPRLDAAAARGVNFTDARTVTPWTWPTIATLFTGRYPHDHGVHTGEGFYLADAHDTLAERFQRHGYTTGAFITNLLIGTVDRFDQGFETFVQTPYARAGAVFDRFLAWLDGTGGLARFAYVHAFDPHMPYLAPRDYRPDVDGDEATLARRVAESHAAGAVDEEALDKWMAIRRAHYAAEVAYFDDAFGALMDELEARGILDDLILVFVSDHGEEFYEHGLIDHGFQLFDESVRVPLFVTGYGRSAIAPRVVDTPVEIRGIARTLARMLGLEGADDPSLGDDLLDSPLPEAVFGHADKGRDPDGSGDLVEVLSIVRNRWKLIQAPGKERIELYHLGSDPSEEEDRSDSEPAIRDRLLEELRRWRERSLDGRAASRVAADAEATRLLEEMGYLEGG